jgi:hypothetical protein
MFRFSGGGVASPSEPPLVAPACDSETSMETNIAADWESAMTGAAPARNALVKDLKACWANFVKPALTAQSTVSVPDNLVDGSPQADGGFSAQLTWPDGVDPLQIDILASLEYDHGILSPVARFDRITQSAGKNGAAFARSSGRAASRCSWRPTRAMTGRSR